MTLNTGVMMLKIQLYIIGITYILNKYSNKNYYLKFVEHFTILLLYCIFDQINVALVTIRDIFQ